MLLVAAKILAERQEEISGNIKGEKGTTVEITVLRGEAGEEVRLTITRDTIQAETVKTRMLEDEIGYLAISEFDSVTLEQYKEGLAELKAQGMEGLIVDLRGNPGGNLDTVCEILDLMLPKGLIVYMEDKDGNRQEFTSDAKQEVQVPLAVLVDGNSASASEIYAGAIQDYGIGQIVGTKTYGKGVVQTIYDLKDGTSLKLTVAEYFTPNGRNIDGEGITPDVEVTYQRDENDPEAAHIVFEEKWPIVMVGLDLTYQALATTAVKKEIAAIDSEAARFLTQVLTRFSENYKRSKGFDEPPVHDPCAVARVIDETIVKAVSAPIHVEYRGDYTAGMTVTEDATFNAVFSESAVDDGSGSTWIIIVVVVIVVILLALVFLRKFL